MCRDPKLSSRRQRRLELTKKKGPKRYRPWSQLFFIKGKTDVRRQTRDKIELVDSLSERTTQPDRDPEPYSIKDSLVHIAVKDQREQDARDMQAFAEAFPYADLNVA